MLLERDRPTASTILWQGHIRNYFFIFDTCEPLNVAFYERMIVDSITLSFITNPFQPTIYTIQAIDISIHL